ncbi:hypothetical protein DSO57_1038555 [Entomophthora muscae]|uniref:Uncharacterized protein n=1 Tax=Entomophthora muscae TaxID=34485 RepID=A0ACC2RDF0_9FUNG|nr:hypothetical protein DSO57_1038555 [Entomophthora muscae]
MKWLISCLFLLAKARIVSNQFFGVVYSPYRNGACPTLENIHQDIGLVGPMAQRIHLYGMDCNQTQMILDTMSELVPRSTAMLGMWVRGEGRFEKELGVLDKVLAHSKHHSRIDGICVGNEELYTGSATPAQLIVMLDKVRRLVAQHGLKIPVFTTDVPNAWTPELAAASDSILANIHPYFDHGSNNPAKNAAVHVMQQYDALSARFSSLNKKVVIGETGWPSGGAPLSTSGPATPKLRKSSCTLFYASVTLATFLITYLKPSTPLGNPLTHMAMLNATLALQQKGAFHATCLSNFSLVKPYI